jgi:flagellar hook-associated protein 1 FlgK
MSGVGLLLSIAKDALAAQRYGMDVTAHNIANVNTEGYSRQRVIYETRQPAPYGGVLLGRGVDTTEVARVSDQFVENRLMQQGSSMLYFKEMETYMQVLEGVFSEDSERSISALLAGFWNVWLDLTNNPPGTPERIALYQHSVSLSEQFNALDADLTQLETDLTNAVGAGIDEINEIASEIAQINGEISRMEANTTANDPRDTRNMLVSELSGYLDVKTFEEGNGLLTVITAKGSVLVSGNEAYELRLGGDDTNRVLWEGSGGTTTDITDYLGVGKLGGWLDMRDEVIAKYKLDLDALAKEFIWAVNHQHSQGVGLKLFSGDVTGTYKTDSSGLLSTLTYGQKIDYTEDFRMWIDDGSSPTAVTVDMGISTAGVTNWGAITFDTDETYTIAVTNGGLVSDGSSTIKWKKGAGAWSGDIAVNGAGNCVIDGQTVNFDNTKTLVAGNTLTVNTDAAGDPDPLVLTPSGTANSISDTYRFTVKTGGTIGTDTLEVEWSNSIASGTFTLGSTTTSVEVDGMTLPFTSGTLFADDVFTITTDADGTPTANLPSDWHWTLESFKDQFNAQATGVTASVTSDNALKFSPASGYSLGFCDRNFDDCGLLAALGINTFLDGSSAGSIGTNAQIANKDYIAAGEINNNVGMAVPATGNASTGSITTAGPYTDADDATYTIRIEAGGATFTWKKGDSAWSAPATAISIGSPQTINDGVTLTFNPGTYVAGDTFTIAVTASPNPSQTLASGDNTNAIAIADLQYASADIAEWTCDRANGNTKGTVNDTFEVYYHAMVGIIGIKSINVLRARVFNEAMVSQLGEIRDSISAVSLDEEMTNLIKFQHAYAAAAKIIGASDEMLETLINVI